MSLAELRLRPKQYLRLLWMTYADKITLLKFKFYGCNKYAINDEVSSLSISFENLSSAALVSQSSIGSVEPASIS